MSRGAGTDGSTSRSAAHVQVPARSSSSYELKKMSLGFDLVRTRTTIQRTSGAVGIVVGWFQVGLDHDVVAARAR